MKKNIKFPLILLTFFLLLTPTTLFSLDNYWNLGTGGISWDFSKDSYHFGGQLEVLNFYFRDYKTNLGFKLIPIKSYIYSKQVPVYNDKGFAGTESRGELKYNLGTGADFFWSPFNINEVSRCGPFVSLYGGIFPHPEFQIFVGVEFLWAMTMLFENTAMPWVVDFVHIRAGFWTQNQSFRVTVGIDLSTIILLIMKISIDNALE